MQAAFILFHFLARLSSIVALPDETSDLPFRYSDVPTPKSSYPFRPDSIRIAPSCRSSLCHDSLSPRFGRNPRPAEKSSVSTCPYDKEARSDRPRNRHFSFASRRPQKPRSRIESSLPSSNGLRRNRKPRHTFGIPIPGEFQTAAVRSLHDRLRHPFDTRVPV